MSDIKENKIQTPTPVVVEDKGTWDSIKDTMRDTLHGFSSFYGEYFGLAKV
jgi:hypothetical protein